MSSTPSAPCQTRRVDVYPEPKKGLAPHSRSWMEGEIFLSFEYKDEVAPRIGVRLLLNVDSNSLILGLRRIKKTHLSKKGSIRNPLTKDDKKNQQLIGKGILTKMLLIC